MIKTTLKQSKTTGKAIQLILHGIRFKFEHLGLLKHRAMTSAGKPMSINFVCTYRQKNVALSGSLFTAFFLKDG